LKFKNLSPGKSCVWVAVCWLSNNLCRWYDNPLGINISVWVCRCLICIPHVVLCEKTHVEVLLVETIEVGWTILIDRCVDHEVVTVELICGLFDHFANFFHIWSRHAFPQVPDLVLHVKFFTSCSRIYSINFCKESIELFFIENQASRFILVAETIFNLTYFIIVVIVVVVIVIVVVVIIIIVVVIIIFFIFRQIIDEIINLFK